MQRGGNTRGREVGLTSVVLHPREQRRTTTKVGSKVEVKEKVLDEDDGYLDAEVDDEQQRLFSNLDVETLQHQPGSVLGSVSLVAGTTVGAGILALPAVTAGTGYLPSSAVILGCWAYSCVTGLLLAEVNLFLMCELGRGGVSMLSMAEDTFGGPGRILAGTTYVFLHYSLLVAYISRGGELISGIADFSPALASVAFGSLLGVTIYASNPSVLDRVNTALVGGVVLSFFGILAVAFGKFDASQLGHADVGRVMSCVPVVALSFVFHNIVPTVTSSLEGDRRKITTAIVAGTTIPLVMFLLWNAAILGYNLDGSDAADGSILDPLKVLEEDATVGTYIMSFSLLAVATSFIGFVLGLVDFIADGLNMPVNTKSLVPFSLTLVPPALFAVVYPDAFLSALEYAGTYGVLALFGVLPAAMAWKIRERKDLGVADVPSLVPGGVPMLVVVGGAALGVITQQTLINLGGTQF
ncbi:tyrosine-specific transport protein [Chloropicon primus]|uniref:Tyrosine-specific transport protein n=1 Tax=Chloropicon primus TaxID=1764295 RepID=A0A5B8MJA0_9CHLO|nr:tyrosine-specific transport protein [Chloropicon primus]UPQ98631.1 tyrosine-specific transport protein [Chloropicon primus]|eukprot:QDZ19422.1 tyrosine-specific transport protein [Chloropicon primus]